MAVIEWGHLTQEVTYIKKSNGKLANHNTKLIGANVELETTHECKNDYISHLVFLLRLYLSLFPIEVTKEIEVMPPDFGLEVTPKSFHADAADEVAKNPLTTW